MRGNLKCWRGWEIADLVQRFVGDTYEAGFIALADHDAAIATRDRRIEELVCPYCKNDGVHLCPDVAEPILISCTRIGCVYSELASVNKKLAEARKEIGKQQDKIEMQQDQLAGLSVDIATAKRVIEKLREQRNHLAGLVGEHDADMTSEDAELDAIEKASKT